MSSSGNGNGNGGRTLRPRLEVVEVSPRTVQREERKQKLAPYVFNTDNKDLILDLCAVSEETCEVVQGLREDWRKHNEEIFKSLPNAEAIAKLQTEVKLVKDSVDKLTEVIGREPPDPVEFARASHSDTSPEELHKISQGYGMAAKVALLFADLGNRRAKTALTILGGGGVATIGVSLVELGKAYARAKGWIP